MAVAIELVRLEDPPCVRGSTELVRGYHHQRAQARPRQQPYVEPNVPEDHLCFEAELRFDDLGDPRAHLGPPAAHAREGVWPARPLGDHRREHVLPQHPRLARRDVEERGEHDGDERNHKRTQECPVGLSGEAQARVCRRAVVKGARCGIVLNCDLEGVIFLKHVFAKSVLLIKGAAIEDSRDDIKEHAPGRDLEGGHEVPGQSWVLEGDQLMRIMNRIRCNCRLREHEGSGCGVSHVQKRRAEKQHETKMVIPTQHTHCACIQRS